ncbi:chorismate mutase [Mycolicibacterium mageritense]
MPLPVGRTRGVVAIAIVLVAPTVIPWPSALADQASPLTKLVDDAAQRLATADPVAAFKYRTGGAVDDPIREQQVIDTVTAAAASRHIDVNFVRRVFRDQIDATDSVEHTRFGQWKIDPQSAPIFAPNLTSSRDVINALNTAIVDDISEQWPALHSITCRADLETAKAAAISEQHLDEVYLPALSYATHGYCQ